MTRRYAESTSVPVVQSRAEVEALLVRHGAHQVAIAVDNAIGRAIVVFGLEGRRVRLQLSTRPNSKNQTKAAQYERAAWRRLLMIVKAKLELVKDGQSTVEREFLADVMLPDGSTVHERLEQQLGESYRTGAMPPLLPGMGET